MNHIPSILMVSWNRREYFERTIKNTLRDPSEFRLYLWDNASADGVRDIINDLRDDRIAAKFFSPENVGQFHPWHWFMSNCQGDIAGKLDDDILGELGWMTRLSTIIADSTKIGVLGAWIFLRSEWDEQLARHKLVKVGPHTIFRNAWVGGCIFLGRLDVLKEYSVNDQTRLGVPIDQPRMTKDGLISGFPMPMLFAENLDDPRSPHCRTNRPGGWDEFAAYSARMRNFSGPEEYGAWIAADARKILDTPVADQVRMFLPTPMDRLKSKMSRGIRKFQNFVRSSVDQAGS